MLIHDPSYQYLSVLTGSSHNWRRSSSLAQSIITTTCSFFLSTQIQQKAGDAADVNVPLTAMVKVTATTATTTAGAADIVYSVGASEPETKLEQKRADDNIPADKLPAADVAVTGTDTAVVAVG